MNRTVLLIYGDSLSLPRGQDGISCFDTYPELLREIWESNRPGSRVAVLNRSRGGTPIEALYAGFVQDSAYMGDGEAGRILVIQCGIVDCAPRPVSPHTRARIAGLPTALRWAAARVLHHARPLLLRRGRSWRNTDREPFAATLAHWIARARRLVDRIYVINIAPAPQWLDEHSPGLSASIDEYNITISGVVANAASPVVQLIDVHGAIQLKPDGVQVYIRSDGHHLSGAGHRLYAQLIARHEIAQDLR